MIINLFCFYRVKTFSTFVLIRTSYAWTTTKCLIEPTFKIYIVHVLYRGVGVIRMMEIDKKSLPGFSNTPVTYTVLTLMRLYALDPINISQSTVGGREIFFVFLRSSGQYTVGYPKCYKK